MAKDNHRMNDEEDLRGNLAFQTNGSPKVNYLCCVCRFFMPTAVVIVPLFFRSSSTLALCFESLVVLNCLETQGWEAGFCVQC